MNLEQYLKRNFDIDGGIEISVEGGLTDAELRAAAVSVDGPLTDAQLRAADVPVQHASTALPTGAPLVGQRAIGVTGTAVQLSAASVPLPSGMVIVAAHPDNAAAITVGTSTVTNTVDGSGNGAILAPGEAIAVFAANVNAIYINGTANDIASYSAA